jgi:hypothetical protein
MLFIFIECSNKSGLESDKNLTELRRIAKRLKISNF